MKCDVVSFCVGCYFCGVGNIWMCFVMSVLNGCDVINIDVEVDVIGYCVSFWLFGLYVGMVCNLGGRVLVL